MSYLNVVILDNDQSSCERLRRILNSFDFIGEIWCCINSLKGIKTINEEKPEIIFLDIELEDNITGFDVIEKIDRSYYSPFIIMVTGYPQYSIKAIRHGVFDYLMKPIDIDELKTSLNRLLQKTIHKKLTINAKFCDLSDRECEILFLVLEGRSSEDIAEFLFISVHTVNTHRRNILRKTGAKSVLDLYKINNSVHV